METLVLVSLLALGLAILTPAATVALDEAKVLAQPSRAISPTSSVRSSSGGRLGLPRS